MITSPWALESGVGQMLKEQLHKSHIFKPMVLQKKILTKKKVKDVLPEVHIPISVVQDDALPSCFSSFTINWHPFHDLTSYFSPFSAFY